MTVEHSSPAPRRLLTPTAAARKLGCSRCRIYGLIREGRLEAARSERFTRLDADAVAILATTYRVRHRRPRGSQLATRVSGSLSAEVFRAFERGASLVQIVTELAVNPAVVRRLWAEWKTSLTAGEIASRDRELQREKDKRDSQQARAEHRRELAQIQAKATVEAARIAARASQRSTAA